MSTASGCSGQLLLAINISLTSEVRESFERFEVIRVAYFQHSSYMAIFARVIFGLLRHKYIPCNKHELKPTLTITEKNGFMMIEFCLRKYHFSLPKISLSVFPLSEFCHPQHSYRILSFPHFVIPAFYHSLILSPALFHPHFAIRVLTFACYHPRFLIRIFPSAIRSSLYRGPFE